MVLRVLTRRQAGGQPSADLAFARGFRLHRRFISYSTMALLVVFLVFLGLWVAMQAYMHAVSAVDHSRDVKRSVNRMMVAVTNAETEQRGYLLTHLDEEMKPYLVAHAEALPWLDKAAELTKDNSVQQERVERMKVLAEQRLNELDQVLLLDKAHGLKAAQARLQEGVGMEQMARLRALNDLFQDEEQDLQAERTREAEWLSGLLIAGLVSFALILGWFMWYGLRQLERENAAEKRLAEMLSTTLAEKNTLLEQRELLLQEVNHRVKNSLNQVAGILRLQLRGLPNGKEKSPADPARGALTQALHRISAIGRVHEQMYKSEQLGVVAAPAFLSPLAEEIVASLLAPESVRLRMEIEPIALPLEKAVPLTLVVNELLTNAAKYAPRPGKRCELMLALTQQNPKRGMTKKAPAINGDWPAPLEVCLTVSDNGPGLPADFAPEKAKSLGMRLVTSLCRQLDGTLTVQSSRQGTTFTLMLPLATRLGEGDGLAEAEPENLAMTEAGAHVKTAESARKEHN